MEKEKFNSALFLIILFFGWFGIDKLYHKNVLLFLTKLFLLPLGLGIIWNIYDLVCCTIGKYKLNPIV